MPNLFARTIKGKNLVGKTANTLLPFPKTREVIGAALAGTKRGLPLPEFKDADREEKILLALNTIEKIQKDSESNEEINLDVTEQIHRIYSILKTGEAGKKEISPKAVATIEKVFSALPLLAYLVYAITTGDFSLSALLALLDL